MRSIPLSVLTNNLAQIYELYKKVYKNGEYTLAAFNHMNEEFDESKEPREYYELIIENGFNIYILINLFLDNSNKHESAEDEELNEFIKQFPEDNVSQLFKNSVFGEVTKLGKSLFMDCLGCVKTMKKNIIDKSFGAGEDEKELKASQKEVEKKQLIREAVSFFRSNMAHIEIVRDGQLQKIYFPLLPFCKFLAKSLKTEFHETVTRTSTKAKLADLMEKADFLIEHMKHDEKLAQFFNKYKLIGILGNHVKLWEYASFYIGLVLNIFVISSYTSDAPDRLKDPYLFLDFDIKNTKEIFTILGILNLVFSSLVVANFFLKRAPVLLGDIWKGFFTAKFSLIKTPLKFVFKVIQSLFKGLKDFDILYYILVIMFALFGLLVHPFFFFFQLTDFLRIELLKNVVKAVWIPRASLGLTFLVFVLLEYYFTLIGYSFFSSHYATGRCESLWNCFLTTFDNTFKVKSFILFVNVQVHWCPGCLPSRSGPDRL